MVGQHKQIVTTSAWSAAKQTRTTPEDRSFRGSSFLGGCYDNVHLPITVVLYHKPPEIARGSRQNPFVILNKFRCWNLCDILEGEIQAARVKSEKILEKIFV